MSDMEERRKLTEPEHGSCLSVRRLADSLTVWTFDQTIGCSETPSLSALANYHRPLLLPSALSLRQWWTSPKVFRPSC